MSYEVLAQYYDELMKEVPYDEWLRVFSETFTDKNIKSILDIGAGTGKITIPLLKKGFDVTAVDLSEDMLTVLHEKLEENQVQAQLICQDMTELDLQVEYDCILSFCDSINYLTTKEDVLKAFESFYRHLKPGGYLLFDSHTIHKMKYIYPNVSFGHAGSEVSYIWNVFTGEVENSIIHELTFFVENEDGTYERFDEDHTQQAFSKDEYMYFLNNAGFIVLNTFTDFVQDEWNEKGERMFFLCQKPE